MRAFKNAWFVRFARRADLCDEQLQQVLAQASRGLIDADLGGGVIKQRIARPGEGKSGGYRTIVLYRHGERAFFVYGYAKSCEANIRQADLLQFRKMASLVLSLSDEDLALAVKHGVFEEVQS